MSTLMQVIYIALLLLSYVAAFFGGYVYRKGLSKDKK